eukprot:3714237-Pyramimonas_sp.AAC.1
MQAYACVEERREKGTPAGVVNRAKGPALGSWEDQPPAAYLGGVDQQERRWSCKGSGVMCSYYLFTLTGSGPYILIKGGVDQE